jgi:hypothetical protein
MHEAVLVVVLGGSIAWAVAAAPWRALACRTTIQPGLASALCGRRDKDVD